MKLNGWQRIGVVASSLWAIGAAIYERNGQVNSATQMFEFDYGHCLPELVKACTDKADASFSNHLALDFVSVSNIVFVAIGPVLAGWVLAYLIVKIVRWVTAGF